MKDCSHIRSILMTDYVDGEIDNDSRRIIEEHLTACPECRQLVTMVKGQMSVFSEESAKKKVPSHVWQSIVKEIGGEERKANTLTDLVRVFTQRLTLPRLAPALVGMALLVLSASFFLYTQHIRQGYENTNFEYVNELFTNVSPAAVPEHEGLGTPIEEYFL